ncbi:MAG: zinc-ribbon domain-containing protein [Candidatus Gastranaerophilales bacterium]|nr:zinc-ribbon domain-containing protein [Candidatus Gastranaerophilales bacterium]
MTYETRELTCADCGETFEFTAEEQEFYSSKGFSEPKRCPKCRAARKNARNSNSRHQYGRSY